jgi:FMN-dependent NADH-azoreductase
MQILHVDSSPQGDRSVSRELSSLVVAALMARRPEAGVVHRDLAAAPPSHADADVMDFVRFRQLDTLTPRQHAEKAWTGRLLDEFLAADVVVIGAPMYNFTIPTQLKAWIDRICQPGVTFRYTPDGPVGLATGKRAILVCTRGGLYSAGPQARRDFQTTYLREILAFMGVTDVGVVLAEGVNISPDHRTAALRRAREEIESCLDPLTDAAPAA